MNIYEFQDKTKVKVTPMKNNGELLTEQKNDCDISSILERMLEDGTLLNIMKQNGNIEKIGLEEAYARATKHPTLFERKDLENAERKIEEYKTKWEKYEKEQEELKKWKEELNAENAKNKGADN